VPTSFTLNIGGVATAPAPGSVPDSSVSSFRSAAAGPFPDALRIRGLRVPVCASADRSVPGLVFRFQSRIDFNDPDVAHPPAHRVPALALVCPVPRHPLLPGLRLIAQPTLLPAPGLQIQGEISFQLSVSSFQFFRRRFRDYDLGFSGSKIRLLF